MKRIFVAVTQGLQNDDFEQISFREREILADFVWRVPNNSYKQYYYSLKYHPWLRAVVQIAPHSILCLSAGTCIILSLITTPFGAGILSYTYGGSFGDGCVEDEQAVDS